MYTTENVKWFNAFCLEQQDYDSSFQMFIVSFYNYYMRYTIITTSLIYLHKFLLKLFTCNTSSAGVTWSLWYKYYLQTLYIIIFVNKPCLALTNTINFFKWLVVKHIYKKSTCMKEFRVNFIKLLSHGCLCEKYWLNVTQSISSLIMDWVLYHMLYHCVLMSIST